MGERKWTREEVRAERRPAESRVHICIRGDLLAELDRMRAELRDVEEADKRFNRTPEAPELRRRIADVESEVAEARVTFVFRAVGNEAWSDLIAEHPPRDDDKALWLDHNPETFPPAAVAASCVEPDGMDLEWAQEIFAEWSVGEVRRLWTACLAANNAAGDVPKAVGGTETPPATAPSSTTAARKESREASS